MMMFQLDKTIGRDAAAKADPLIAIRRRIAQMNELAHGEMGPRERRILRIYAEDLARMVEES